MDGDSKRTNDRVPSLIGSLDSPCRYSRFCAALTALVSPVQNIIFTLLVPIAQQPESAGVLGRLSQCLWKELSGPHFPWGMERAGLTVRWGVGRGKPQGPIYMEETGIQGGLVFSGANGEGIIRFPFPRRVLSGHYFLGTLD